MKNKVFKVVALIFIFVFFIGLTRATFETQASDFVFEDSFDSVVSEQWKNKVGTVTGGKYVLGAGESDLVMDLSTTEDYIVSADVKVHNDASEENDGFVSIVSRAHEDMSTGYMFGIGVNKTGTAYLRLYRLGGEGDAEIIKQSGETVEEIGEIVQGETYNLTMAISGNRIICLINDVLFVDTTDSLYTSGYVGVDAVGVSGTFDNFTVETIPEQKVEKMTLVEHSEEVSLVEQVQFTIDVAYNSVYGSEIITQDTEGVSLAGYDGEVGERTVTVSYLGEEISFPLNVVEEYEEEILWNDDFSAGISDQYHATSTKNTEYNFTYVIENNNETAYAEFPNLNGANLPVTASLLLKEALTGDWDKYSVSVDGIISSDSTTSTTRNGGFGIFFANTGTSVSTAFSLRVISDGTITLQQGSNRITSFTASHLGLNIQKGQTIKLRADVYGECVELYVNSKLIYVYAFTTYNVNPAAGFILQNGTISVDNLNVVSLIERGQHAVQEITVVNPQMEKITDLESKILFSNNVLVRAEYIDGSVGFCVLKEEMVSGYDASTSNRNPQTITVKYGECTTTFQYTYVPYMFYDYFAGEYLSADWNNTKNQTLSSSIVDEKLKITYKNDSEFINSSLYSYITGGNDWTDYTVSADVLFDENISETTRQSGIVARYTSSSDCYVFRLTYSGSSYSATLSRGKDILANYNAGFIMDCLEKGKKLDTGITYNLKMTLVGNEIRLYIDNTFLDVYYCDEDSYLASGTAGVYNITNTVYFDNFIVQEASALEISQLRITGTENNIFELYEGEDINVWDYDVEIAYSDGTHDTVSLTPEMISEFDNTALGKQRITVTVDNHEMDAYVSISERPQYLEEFSESIQNFNSNIAEDNLEAFWNVKEVYDFLSNYEIEQLEDSVVEKYKKLYEQADRLLYPEVKEEILLDGTLKKEDVGSWGDGLDTPAGKWNIMNGMFFHSQRPYFTWGTGWRVPELYGEITMISADFQMLDDFMYVGVCLDVMEHRYYQLRVSSKSVDAEGNYYFQLQLKEYTAMNGEVNLATADPREFGVEIKKGEWFNLSLVAVEGKINGYVNQTLVISYDDSTGNCFTTGECGIRISEGDALIKNIRAYGTEIEQSETVYDATQTSYTDDFEDEKVGAEPNYWLEEGSEKGTKNDWKIYTRNNSKVYGTTNQTDTTKTWLHVYDDDPNISVRFMVESKNQDATFGFLTRYSPSTAFVKVGYDCTESMWYIASQESESAGLKTVYADTRFAMETGTWYTAHIVEEGEKVSLYINDALLIETEEITQTSRGRVGVYTQGASIYIDDVKCTFNGGDIPQDGVVNYVFTSGKGQSHMEIESIDEKTLIGTFGAKRFLSTDAGATWSEVTNDEEWSGIYVGNMYRSMLKLHDGTYIQILTNLSDSQKQDSEDFSVSASKDCKKWNVIGKIIPDEDKTFQSGKSGPIIHVNSLTEVQLEDGTWRIFCPFAYRSYAVGSASTGLYTVVWYSDDGGKTWTKSETNTRSILPGADTSETTTWSESKVIKCADGSLRLYVSRTKLGCVQYTVSKDGGVTWKGLYQIAEMQCALTSFSVFEDPYAPGTYYMTWVNTTPRYAGGWTPRNRICLAKSTDGMNWEFLMNCAWNPTYVSTLNSEYLFQCIDPSLCVTEDYVYITWGMSEREYAATYSGNHQQQYVNYMRLEKDKLQARAWDASTVENMNYPKTIEYEVMPQTKYGLGDFFVKDKEVTLKITTVGGETYTEKLGLRAEYYSEPNMYQVGTQTVRVHYMNGYDLSYDIEVVPHKTIYYSDDFSYTIEDLANTGLNGTQNFLLENGKLVGKTLDQAYSYLSGNDDWSDYTVEVDVAISGTRTTNLSSSNGKLAGIHVAAPGNSKGSKAGYEFMICKNALGDSAYCALMDRTGGTNNSENVPLTIEWDKTYRLKVVLSGNVIQCYVDDKLMIAKEIGSVQTLSGTIGLHYSGGRVTTFDNLVVYNQDVSSLMLFTEDFSATTEELLSTWKGIDSFAEITDGTLKSNTANDTDRVYLSGHGAWSDYTVEADVTITSKAIKSSGTRNASVYVAVPEGTAAGSQAGYEFMISRYASDTGAMTCVLKDRTGAKADSETVDITLAFDTTYRLKVVVSGNQIACYINDVLMITYEAPEMLYGTIGLKYEGNVTTFDNVSVYFNQEDYDYYDVTYYRNNRETVTHPFKEGFVFAGWYEDATFTTPITKSATTCKAYAKFVDENVLSVKCQITNNTTVESTSTNLRLLTSVDSLMYNAVGFTLKTGDEVSQPIMVSEVYETVYAYVNEENQPYTANQTFAPQSKYFMVHTLTDILQEKFDTEYTVIPMWRTLDGTTVTGVTRTFKISDGYTSGD